MKKKLALAAVICFVFLAGCQRTTPASSTALSESNSPVQNDLIEYEYQYFNAVAGSTITAYSWDNASQIEPDYLVQFFGEKTGLNRLSTDAEPFVIPGDIVESYIKLYFAVDNNYIRQSDSYYDSGNHTYRLPIIGWGAASTKVVAVSEKDDILTLSYEYYSAMDDAVIREGTIDIQRLGPIKYNYISCNSTSIEPQ